MTDIKLKGVLNPRVNIVSAVSQKVNLTGGVTDVVRLKGLVGTYFDVLIGTRISPPLDLSPVVRAGASFINWTASVPIGTLFDVDVSLDGGVTWSAAQNGESIPGIDIGDDVVGRELLVRQVFKTTNPAFTPVLYDISVGLNTYWHTVR
jgi:hypothetical protein